MTITIPTWVLWTLGIVVGVPAAIVTVALAAFGFVVARSLSKGGFWR